VPDDAQLLTDIRLELLDHDLRPVYTAATDRRRVAAGAGTRAEVDLELVSGSDNLAQGIVMRLLTPKGELAALGHADYGSRLHELIGTPNTPTRRSLLKLFILDSLASEPRVAKVDDVSIVPAPGRRDAVDVTLTVIPVGPAPSVVIGPFTLELTP
jgi:phage baseplate assembly protein W